MKTLIFAACLGAVSALTPLADAAPELADQGGVIHLAAFGGPSEHHHRGGKARDTSSTSQTTPQPEQPRAQETAEQHRAYLEKYGFGQ